MLETLRTPPGLLFASYLYRHDLFTQQQLSEHWTQIFGPAAVFVPLNNPLIPYYQKEMGEPLSRFFVMSDQLYPRDELLQTKLLSLNWEKQWSVEGKRQVNVDIGFLSAENFILATTKNYSHRVFLGQDIFADLTFQFQKGAFHSFPWTYPDYLDETKIQFLTLQRLKLLKLLSS